MTAPSVDDNGDCVRCGEPEDRCGCESLTAEACAEIGRKLGAHLAATHASIRAEERRRLVSELRERLYGLATDENSVFLDDIDTVLDELEKPD